MKRFKMFFWANLALAITAGYAQESPYMLSISQAREYALQHNRSLLNARDNVTSSKELLKETIAQGLPQVNGSLEYMTYFNYEMNFSLGGSGGGNTPITFDEADETAFYNGIMSMFGSSEPIVMDDQFSGNVQLSQIIFSGQYLAGVQTAKIACRLADQSTIASELDVKENVTNTYLLILTAERTLQIIGENLSNLNSILRHTNNLYNAGVAEATDVDQIKITVSQLKNSQKSLERMNQLNYNMLKFQLGVAPDAEIKLSDSLELLLANVNSRTFFENEYDITNNINYQLMESQVMLNKKQVDMQNWAYAPTVAGYYSYTEKFLTTSFDLTPNQLAGINVTVPVFSSGMRRAKTSQAKIALEIAERNREMIKDQLETQKRQLLFNFQNALENFETQKENVTIAGRVYKSIQNKYEQGLSSSLNLTQANGNYLNAENNYVTSVLTLLQAQTSLEKLYNKL